jgi:DNA-directed RNA polymerase subunit E'/Rpb7
MKFIISTIKLRIILKCDEQSKNYKSLLKQKLKDEYEKKAFEKYGIIDEIIDIESIHHEELMRTSPCVYFIINTKVSIYYPKKDDIITIPIYKILNYGIYIQKDSFRVLIPNSSKENAIDYKNFQVGQNITIQLTEIRFEKQGFHCLANIIV